MSKTRRNIPTQSHEHANANGNGKSNGRLHVNRIEDLFTAPAVQEKAEGPDLSIKQPIIARTPNQKLYLKSIRDNDLTIAIGPPGVGKSRVSLGYAATALSKGWVERVILVRPAISCDEELGFLPGDLLAKLGPFLRPSYDELLDFYTFKQLDHLTSGKFPIIEGAALGQIKGRTFKNAVVILDEAQDATYKQLKNFLTRMGENSKVIVTGDTNQSDLYDDRRDSPLEDVMRKMTGATGVGFVEFTPEDIQRHPRIEQILERL